MSEFPMLIGGAMVEGAAEQDVINPATEGVVAKAPHASAAQIGEAVAAAKAAFPAWSARPIAERAAVLSAIADIVEANLDELARLTTLEQGKPFPHAQFEVRGVSGMLRYYASVDLPVELLEDSAHRRVELHRRPLGVVAAIIPWNFPLALFATKIANALISGNTVVVKPAATTPLGTLRIGALIRDVVPAGVLNIVSDANDLGAVLTDHPDVRKITFTGSTETGKKVMASAASDLKRVTLELGGNDAAIVLDDADPKKVAQGLFQGAFANSGQVCLAIKRVYADERVYDSLVEELATLANAAVVGDGLEQGTQFGPLQNKAQYERIKSLIEDARSHGTIVAGGEASDGKGYFITPTIVRDIEDGTRLVDEEQFGPILPVIKVKDAEDALRRANASPYGLGGSVWSSDTGRAAALAARMDTGTAWVNKTLDLGPTIPFAGAKSSGLGVEYGVEGLHEFTQVHVVNIAK
ncbi:MULTISPECIES: aldehyde dehydrogenase family protein [unclassified Sphingobium]|uniref:aldehyde dehydrogenase family protein n=1 Tax=unclassified Sphingobium TaxID=2611147 RepID=UPI000D159744|nr:MULTISPECIES: aldehyde dehydrogenase family protein [unclassified Sphingobium]MBG6120149.1 acyl-CoA reductase-like NAD-dependent aldehyde dehydrogenase [Sphingobium sp. JAI105]PSO12814.1 aldehyde dehydrogenase [Sphingobium sp. AEW4]TWD05650.1 acyl-CoA reductase-like NAD-dependent aldehyde dehydrogenase [Sphingobium sp. AEW010]TWD23203.1 acyl-CoA reductase-like NAD-dependent aldehyde dehydrogenase [Sphingobium sp. AEW013]TWD25063.1 acyl-CoA reductase-like NAD-dependent aldehyde dehydrogenase